MLSVEVISTDVLIPEALQHHLGVQKQASDGLDLLPFVLPCLSYLSLMQLEVRVGSLVQ